MKPKLAKKVAIMWEYTCPYCGGQVVNVRNGSTMFDREDVDRGQGQCDDCTKLVRVK